jgi:CheY-like chemotaxis protein
MPTVHLLVAEDDLELRRWLCLVLRRLPCRITEACDGDELEALLLGEERFDLVVTDIRMPRRSGLEAAVVARQAGVTTPFIFLTGYSDETTVEVAATLGNSVLLSKPVDSITLLAQVRRLLSPAEKIQPRGAC